MKQILAAFILLIALVGLYVLLSFVNPFLDRGEIACTLEAKLCPDGSYVSRTGVNCEFASCPTE